MHLPSPLLPLFEMYELPHFGGNMDIWYGCLTLHTEVLHNLGNNRYFLLHNLH